MIELLRKLFETNPEKSTIVLYGKCSDCGCEVIIEITRTSGGFGLQGGVLFRCYPDGYFAKFTDCCKVNPKVDDIYKLQRRHVSIS